MIDGIYSVIVIFLIFSVGVLFTIRKLWPQNTPAVLSAIVVKIAVPALVVISITDRFTPELLRGSAKSLLVIALYMALLFLTGKIFSKAFHLPAGKKHVYEISFIFANAVYIGLPVNQLVLGADSLPYLFTFYLVSITVFWTIGAHELAKASPLQIKGFSFKRIMNPAFVSVLIACILVETQISIPVFLDSALRYLSALAVPLALLVIGSNLVFFTSGIPKIYKDEWFILCAKFIISPLYMYALLSIFGIKGMAFKVFLLTATMPCHTQTAILAELYEVESAYASKLVSISTLASLITIPFFTSIILYIS